MLPWQGKIQMERLTEIYLQVYGSKKKNRLVWIKHNYLKRQKRYIGSEIIQYL